MIPRRITIDVRGWKRDYGPSRSQGAVMPQSGDKLAIRPRRRKRKGLSATLAERVIDRQVQQSEAECRERC